MYDNIDVFSEQEIFENEWFFEIFDSYINDAVKKNPKIFKNIEKSLEKYDEITFEEQDTGFEKIYMFCIYCDMEKNEYTTTEQVIQHYTEIIYKIEKKQ